MCGIVGLLSWNAGTNELTTRKMANAIEHRGPDDSGFWGDNDVSLGFRRLAIVDIETGAQPMGNHAGDVQVVFNGEIYNHRELRRELEAAGHVFKSHHSDTEVLVHGWIEWGEGLASRINGMFAFAIWDQKARKLILGRDRYGIKPIYISMIENGIVFGSEVRAVHASGLVPIASDPSSILEYFSLMNFWHGRTPFKNVRLLDPGTIEVFTPDCMKTIKYWDYTFNRNAKGTLKDHSSALQDILLRSVKRQVEADVPVMSYLSGGIDSSAITAAASKLDPNIRAYSCIFDLDNVGADAFVDERDFSRSVARHLKIDRVELELPQDVLKAHMDHTIRALEYPRMGMAYVNNLISARVAQDAKVVLSGMGGDEVTGGYVARYQHIPHTNLKAPDAGDPFYTYRYMLNVTVADSRLEEAFTPEFLRAARGGFDALATIEKTIKAAPSDDSWDVLMYTDATTYLHGLLVLEDKLSMAHSLETRVPLLDNEFVDYLLTIPWDYLTDGETGKIAFREACKPWVPQEVYEKPKMGFGPPDASWYRGILRTWVRGRLSSARVSARGIFKPEFVSMTLDQHEAATHNWVALIWCMLSFDSWCDQTGLYGGKLAV